ncbi:MAG: tetratricopeptide repeat protein [Elusimicrobiales bacterium]|nr:tetratricopeptide repeat protein [Elusimicrobiales bacterium]
MQTSGADSEAVKLAESLMREGRFGEAAALAGRRLAAGDRSSFLLRVRAEAFWAEGRIADALSAAALAASLKPADPRAQIVLAQLYLVAGRPAAARLAARGLGPQWAPNAAAILAGDVKRFNLSCEVPGLLALFKARFAAGEYAAAFLLAENLLNLRAPAGNEIISVLAAPVTFQSVLYPAAVCAGRIRALCAARLPAGLDVWKRYYLTYLASVPVSGPAPAWERARKKALGEWRRVRPANLRRYGWMFKEIGRKRLFSLPPDHRGARAAFARALASPPPEGDAFGRLAEAELCLGRRRAAFGWLAKGLKACPDQEGPLRAWRGELKLFTGDYAGALADLAAAAAKKAYYADTWLAIALMKTGRLDRALAAADRAVKANPRDGEALVVRGEVWRLKKNHGRARADLLKALKGAFPYRHALWAALNLVLSALEKRDYALARRDLALLAGACRGAAPTERLYRGLESLAGEPKKLLAALERTFGRAKGCRRDEAYLFPLWLPGRGQKPGILV